MATGKVTKASFDIRGNVKEIVNKAKTDNILVKVDQKGPNGHPIIHIAGEYTDIIDFINDNYICNDPNNGDALDFIHV